MYCTQYGVVQGWDVEKCIVYILVFRRAAQTPLINTFIEFLSKNIYKITEDYPKF
jgi:hypothetical protein